MAIETSVEGLVAIVIAGAGLAWSVVIGKRQDAREAQRSAADTEEERDKKLASTILSPGPVNDAVGAVALTSVEDSEKFVSAREYALQHRAVLKEMKDLKNVVRSGDRKLDALLGAARIQIREVIVEEENDE
jgi:uncharacterized iron-regulated membrane protein